MSVEIWGLVFLAVLTIVHSSIQGLTLKSHVGNAWTVGARDKPVDAGIIAGRAQRAKENFLETAPAFISLVLVIAFTDRSNSVTEIGTIVYITGRIVYLPLYLSGIVWVRSISWNIATAGLAAILVGIFV